MLKIQPTISYEFLFNAAVFTASKCSFVRRMIVVLIILEIACRTYVAKTAAVLNSARNQKIKLSKQMTSL